PLRPLAEQEHPPANAARTAQDAIYSGYYVGSRGLPDNPTLSRVSHPRAGWEETRPPRATEILVIVTACFGCRCGFHGKLVCQQSRGQFYCLDPGSVPVSCVRCGISKRRAYTE